MDSQVVNPTANSGALSDSFNSGDSAASPDDQAGCAASLAEPRFAGGDLSVGCSAEGASISAPLAAPRLGACAMFASANAEKHRLELLRTTRGHRGDEATEVQDHVVIQVT